MSKRLILLVVSCAKLIKIVQCKFSQKSASECEPHNVDNVVYGDRIGYDNLPKETYDQNFNQWRDKHRSKRERLLEVYKCLKLADDTDKLSKNGFPAPKSITSFSTLFLKLQSLQKLCSQAQIKVGV